MFIPISNPLHLKEGDKIRNQGSGEVYTVIQSGSRPVAIKDVMVSNLSEWEQYKP